MDENASDDDDWTLPYGPHWIELASLALGLQVGALATVPVIVGKNTLPDIFFLAVVFIAGVFTLYEVVTAKSFIKRGVLADLLQSSERSLTHCV